MASANKEEELLSFLTDTIGMDEDEVEAEAQEMLDNDEVLLTVNAYEKIKEENVAQPQEASDIDGAYLGQHARTRDGEVTGYVTWVFSEADHSVVRVNSDDPIVNGDHRQFTQVTLTGVERWENLESGYEWLQATDDSAAEFDDDELAIDLVLDFAQTVGEVDEDDSYLVIAEVAEVDTLGEFHQDTGDYLGRKPVIEDEDNANIRLVLEEARSGEQATIKLQDPRDIAALSGIEFERLMKIAAQSDAQEMSQQLYTVLEGETVVVFGRGSAYVNGEEVTDGDGNRRPWLTLSNFDVGFITSLDELEASA
ncbi:hypothetical protein HUG10_20490 (plasmid) [Halorarum halophilum]|uniref:Uncharacterized protein n=1 Tax=Halorarum halophilum TaxID=2743090 RepID=A0A7D5GHM3_9EURY|nr:hypothetical protein [Halobaculum halophilum]QLG29988.1 hypothetical protein HUG10_20490 [Halobaculum halophilum]